MGKEEVRATVVSCEPSETIIRGTVAPCFEIMVEFRTKKGIVSQSFKRGTAIDIGTTIKMSYDHRYGSVEMSTQTATKINNIPILLGSIVSVGVLVAALVIGAVFGGFSGKVIGCILGVIICLGFEWVGIFIAFIYPKKHRNMEDCVLLEGRICKYVQTKHGILWQSEYSAVYEYIYGRKMCRVGSIQSQHRRKKIGTKVTIAVNEKTGEAFCVEENKDYNFCGSVLMVIIIPFIAILINEMFTP